MSETFPATSRSRGADGFRKALKSSALSCLLVFSAAAAPACTLCAAGPSGKGANETRAAIFDWRTFGTNLLATTAPFVVIGAVSRVIHCGFPRLGRRPGNASASPDTAFDRSFLPSAGPTAHPDGGR